MRAILQDLTPDKLIRAIEGNLSAWIPELGKLGRTTSSEPPGVKRAIVDAQFALFNSIVETNLPPEEVEPAISFLIADSRKRKVPLLWWTGPSTRPTDLEERLEHRGFKIDEDGPGMAVSLDGLKQDQDWPTGLSIHTVQDDRDRTAWFHAMVAGFEIPPERASRVTIWQDYLKIADPERVKAYLARLDNEPVAISLLSIGAGVAGIYAVATVPHARRKGIGALVTLAPLLYAREMGLKVGVLEASEMGEGVYRSLGFREYCRIRSYRFQS